MRFTKPFFFSFFVQCEGTRAKQKSGVANLVAKKMSTFVY